MTELRCFRSLAASAAMLLSISALPSAVYGQSSAAAAAPAAAPAPAPPPPVVSPEVSADHKITFRLRAPQVEKVMVMGGDIPGNGKGTPMTKGEDGVWTATIGPLNAGAYRYNFDVNGVTVIDPRSPAISESNNNAWSVVYVPGSDFMDTRNVPHGAVASVTYFSNALDKPRRMHIYTPPGYENNNQKYPVFYLLHGASDSDDSWTSAGRANFILDNLIADKKAKPMIVVMPAGHTRQQYTRGSVAASDEFVKDFVGDIMPYVEKHYRTINDRQHRAIAGLSMGGGQTLNIAIPHLDQFAYVGVFSSGVLSQFMTARPGQPAVARPAGPTWEEQNMAMLDNAGLRKDLKLVWFGIGKDDFLLETNNKSVDMLKKHGFTVVSKLSDGGHTWINWRNYLNEFAPQLF